MTTEASVNTTVDSAKFVERLVHRASSNQLTRPLEAAPAKTGQISGNFSKERRDEHCPAYFPHVSIYS